MSGHLNAPAALPPGGEPPPTLPLIRKPCWLQSRRGWGAEKKSPCPCRESNPSLPVYSL